MYKIIITKFGHNEQIFSFPTKKALCDFAASQINEVVKNPIGVNVHKHWDFKITTREAEIITRNRATALMFFTPAMYNFTVLSSEVVELELL